MRIAVVGLGKLGAPLAAVLASKGHDVTGADVNADAVRRLNAGLAPVDEPGLQELVSASRARLEATMDAADAARRADVIFVLVPTPSDETGAFTNAFVESAIEAFGPGIAAAEGHPVVVVSSTVMPGSCDGQIRAALERATGLRVGDTLGLVYSPEFIALGNVIDDMLHPDMVLIGQSDERAGETVEAVYRTVVENDPPFRRMTLVNAELTKIAVNTFVTMKISYANALADLCERLPQADVDVVTDAVGLDSRIGRKYLRGAIAYGGPCFPRDTRAFATLAREVGASPLLAEATHAVNLARSEQLAGFVTSMVPPGGSVGVLGLSYKPDTAVIDESPGVELARALADEGHEVNVFDPVATAAASAALGGSVTPCDTATDLVARSDVVVVTTPWPEFADIPAGAFEGRRRIVVDCWRVVPDDAYGGSVEVVRLGRRREQAGV